MILKLLNFLAMGKGGGLSRVKGEEWIGRGLFGRIKKNELSLSTLQIHIVLRRKKKSDTYT